MSNVILNYFNNTLEGTFIILKSHHMFFLFSVSSPVDQSRDFFTVVADDDRWSSLIGEVLT